ncbi:HNH endonuclease [Antrihabitans sp. NCIMB 15449]|uniref:HNH endonuclease n=1 Tax=Antrihabitans spumae TaxID=3373370 RepID=A0ABW7JVR1_9NOCA
MFDTKEQQSLPQRIAAIRAEIADIDRTLSCTERSDSITEFDKLLSGCTAAQAKLTADLAKARRTERAARGLSKKEQDAGIPLEIGLARRCSHHKGNQYLGFAQALDEDMPHTLDRLVTGDLTEWRATLLVRETACLSREDRRIVDRRLCSDPATLAGKGDKQIAAAALAIAIELDTEALVRRARKATADRCVTSRPAPDTMAYVTALLPVKQAVTVHATLMRDAAAVVAAGDHRTKAQVMADLLVERVTGLSTATAVPMTVDIVISDEALLGTKPAAAEVPGYVPIPADLVKHWLHDTDATIELRRLYANPTTGALTAMESTSRCFPKGMLRMTRFRDRTCRTPWCGAPIKHGDHPKSVAQGGDTTYENSAGLCEACNYAKEADGWSTTLDQRIPGELHSYTITTPTGHQHTSTAPPLPTPLPLPRNRIDAWFPTKRVHLEYIEAA